MSEYRPVQRIYGGQARRYEQRWRHYNQATLQATAEAVRWTAAQRVLDVSCGTGLFVEAARRINPQVSVVGLDISLPMLEQARRKFQPGDRAGFVNALAEWLPFASESFDVVVSASAFHHYRRPLQALQEMRRVLCRGGQLVLTDWCGDYWTCKLCDIALRIVDPSHFRIYRLAQCQALLHDAGFQVENARRFKIDWFWGLMILQASVPQGG